MMSPQLNEALLKCTHDAEFLDRFLTEAQSHAATENELLWLHLLPLVEQVKKLRLELENLYRVVSK